MYSTPLSDAFSTKSEELLLNGKEWEKESVISDRIRYFNKLGIVLGNNYEDYMNNPKCQKLIPPKILLEKISSTKKQLKERMNIEYYESTIEYKSNRVRIDEKNLMDKDDGYSANIYYNGTTCICPNAIFDGSIYRTFPILFLEIGSNNDYIDKDLIHELNHIFELSISKANADGCEYLCGWDVLQGDFTRTSEITTLEKRTEKRKYELFNEIINELISEEIATILHESGNFIFNNQYDSKIYGGTSYERFISLVKEFYKIYKDEIILSRRNGNIQIIYDKVGKENFDALNSLFQEFNSKFSEFSIYTLYNDLKQNKDTDLTRNYKIIMAKKNNILQAMQEYSLEHENAKTILQ